MKRKIIQVAQNTLVVSLPANWVKAQGVDKGDELDCSIEHNKLVLTPPISNKHTRSITVDVGDVDERTLRWKISSLHKQGYDEIIVCNYTEEQYAIIDELTNNLFVGFVIKDRSKLRIVIGQVALVAADEFDRTLRQAFRHTNTMFEEYINALEKGDLKLLEYQLQHEKTNNKLTNFCERLLNKSLEHKEKGHFWYVIAWNLEKIADNFKYVVENTKDYNQPSESMLACLKKIATYYNDYYECFYSFSFEKLTALSKTKKELDKICLEGLTTPDAIYYHYFHMLVLQIADFSASMIALAYEPDTDNSS